MPKGPPFTRENAREMSARGNLARKERRERDKAIVRAAELLLANQSKPQPEQPAPKADESPRARFFKEEADRLMGLMRGTTDPKELQALSVAMSNAEELYCRHAGIAKPPTAKAGRPKQSATVMFNVPEPQGPA